MAAVGGPPARRTKRLSTRLTLGELARILDAELKGPDSYEVTRILPSDQLGEGALAFLARDRRSADLPPATTKGALLMTPELFAAGAPSQPALLVSDPYLAYARVSRLYASPFQSGEGVHASAVVHPEARLGAGCVVGPSAVIEADVALAEGVAIGAGAYLGRGVRIGARTELRPNVVLYPDTLVGADCLIHAGTVVGSDGFGFAPKAEGWEKIAQLGRVRVGDRVEIGANCTIDCGALDDTEIADDVIIDNLVHLAHNTRVGAGSALAGQVGIAGSAHLGRRVLAGGQAGVAGHLRVGDNVQLHGQAMVTNHLPEPGVYGSGIPAQPVRDWRRMVARLRQLDDLTRTVRTLEKQLAEQGQDSSASRNKPAQVPDPDNKQ